MTQETDWIFRQIYDSPTATVDVDPQPLLAKFIERRQFEAELEKTGDMIVDPSWREPIGRVEKKLPTTGSLGKRLGIVRSEITEEEDGTRRLCGFNAAGEVVDVRWLFREISE
jgi:hypothetical protein